MMPIHRRTFCSAVAGTGATGLLAGGAAATQSDELEPVWEITDDIGGFLADGDAVYTVTENSVRAHDPATGESERIVASADGIETFAWGDGFEDSDHIYLATATGIENVSKRGERQWRRPIDGINNARYDGDGGVCITTGGPSRPDEKGGSLVRLSPDGSVDWQTELNWGLVDDLAVTDGTVVVGGFESNSRNDNPLLIRVFDKRTGEERGVVSSENRDQEASSYVEVNLAATGGDTVYAVADHGNDYIEMLRVDASQPTAVWATGAFVGYDDTYSVYLPTPVVVGDGVYGLDGDGYLAKYSTVSGERQWSAGSLVPNGMVPYGGGVLVSAMDDSTTPDGQEERSGTIVLASYSSSGLTNWRRDIGSGPKEGLPFSGPYKVPGIDRGHLVADWGNSLRLFAPPSVRRELQGTPTPTPTPATATATPAPGSPRATATTTAPGSESDESGGTRTATGAGGAPDDGRSTSDGGSDTVQRDLFVPGDGLATLNPDDVPLMSAGGLALSIAGFAYQFLSDD